MAEVIEGKTQRIEPLPDMPGFGESFSKPDITGGDGKLHEIMEGKAELNTAITCHVAELLQAKGVPLAHVRRLSVTSRLVEIVDMIPVEVVVLNEAAERGSYRVRYPGTPAGHVFEEPVVVFHYKTSGRKFFGVDLPCDDPVMIFSDDGATLKLYHQRAELDLDAPIYVVTQREMSVAARRALYEQLKICRRLALDVNTHLKAAWEQQSGRLIDFKIECGVSRRTGKIVVADELNGDSWRAELHGKQLSKQPFRDGADLEAMLGIYQLTEKVARGFWY